MSKLKSQRMKPVNQLAAKQEQEYAIVFAQCLYKVHELKEQLQKLYSYRDGYNQQFIELSNQGVGSNRLQDILKFMTNLNISIEGMGQQIQRQQNICEEKKKLWMEKHNKKRIYNTVTEKYISEEQIIQNKNEQKLMDEFNQIQFRRKLNQKN
ncbi:MAG: flagellar export protein FliJ [gamma proteobacterium symbiont of Taylorina sp.]|nr:flagellar export protein FliJ [gamma proteobacterium symbiont of Taylorina sp.]